MTNLKTFAITPRGQSVFVFITAEDFDNLQQWMPYIAWSGSYLESYPMRTSFVAPTQYIQSIIQT